MVWTDLRAAPVLPFDAEHTLAARRVRASGHHTAQLGRAARAELEFFGQICDALEGIAEVLITGAHTAIANSRNLVEKHRPNTAARILADEGVDHPTEKQRVDRARRCFVKHDGMAWTATPV